MASHLGKSLRNLGPRTALLRWRAPAPTSCMALRLMGGGGVGGDGLPIKVDIGKREVVGFGATGEENYIDNVHYPFPAIRFQEDTAEVAVSGSC